MPINSILSTAVSGLNASAQRVSVSAFNVVNANTPDFSPLRVQSTTQGGGQGTPTGVKTEVTEGTGSVDLATEAVNQIQAAISYTANASLIQTADELAGTLLDLRA